MYQFLHLLTLLLLLTLILLWIAVKLFVHPLRIMKFVFHMVVLMAMPQRLCHMMFANGAL